MSTGLYHGMIAVFISGTAIMLDLLGVDWKALYFALGGLAWHFLLAMGEGGRGSW